MYTCCNTSPWSRPKLGSATQEECRTFLQTVPAHTRATLCLAAALGPCLTTKVRFGISSHPQRGRVESVQAHTHWHTFLSQTDRRNKLCEAPRIPSRSQTERVGTDDKSTHTVISSVMHFSWKWRRSAGRLRKWRLGAMNSSTNCSVKHSKHSKR